MNSWKEQLFLSAHKNPEKIAVMDELHAFTYSSVKSLCDEIRLLLSDNIAEKRPRILVLLPRNAPAAALLISLICNEAIGLFLDSKTPEEELKEVVAHVKPHALIAYRPYPSEQVQRSLPGPEILNSTFQKMQVFFFDEAFASEVVPGSLRWLLHTSGSSGAAKAVMISADNLLQRTQVEVDDFSVTSRDTLLNCLPFSHDLGLNQVLCTFFLGATLYIKSRSVSPLLDCLKTSGAIGLTGTPLLWIDFLKTQSEEVKTNLRYITISGGQLDAKHLEKLRTVFPGVRIVRTYGQTETFRTFINDSESRDIGRLVSGVDIELTEDGELIHFGKTAMLGYLFDPELTSKVVTSEGGVRTRDQFTVDSHGGFHFLGRQDDLIKRFEQRFHLSEVEDVIRRLPGVHEVVAICHPTPVGDWRQHYLSVYVQPAAGAGVTSDEIKGLVQRHLSYFKMPDMIKVIDSFPRTSSYKIDRIQLKKTMMMELPT